MDGFFKKINRKVNHGRRPTPNRCTMPACSHIAILKDRFLKNPSKKCWYISYQSKSVGLIPINKIKMLNPTIIVLWADNSVKIWRTLPIRNPKPDLHNINAHTKFGENPLMFTQVIIRKRKNGWTDRWTYNWGTDRQTHGRPTWNHNTPPLLCGGV